MKSCKWKETLNKGSMFQRPKKKEIMCKRNCERRDKKKDIDNI